MHLGLCTASAVVAAPSSPDGPPDALRRPQDFVARDGTGGVWLPRFGVLAGWDDGSGTAGGDGVVAFACVEGAICCDAGDFLAWRENGSEKLGHGSGGMELLRAA